MGYCGFFRLCVIAKSLKKRKNLAFFVVLFALFLRSNQQKSNAKSVIKQKFWIVADFSDFASGFEVLQVFIKCILRGFLLILCSRFFVVICSGYFCGAFASSCSRNALRFLLSLTS